MKVYEFPYSGSGGKGDSWEAMIDVKLTDEESERLIASAKSHDDMDEDSQIDDIYQKVYQKIVDENMVNVSDMIDEFRSDYNMPEDATDREVVEEYLDNQRIHIHYPEMIL